MIPSVFVFLDSFPLTPNGKIDKKALPKADFESNREEEFVSPSNDIEIKLAHIWQEVLEVETIGINDNLFALGGHSLLASQLISTLVGQFEIDIPVKVLFEKPTIAQLASYLESKLNTPNCEDSDETTSVITINANGTKTPLYFINSTGVANNLKNYLDKTQPLYSLNIFGLTTRINKPFEQLTIQDFAQYLIQDLEDFQPHGPYKLIGYCQDGPLTLEIAQQLQSQGNAVDLVCLVDVTFDRDKKQHSKFFNRLQMIREFKLTYFKPRFKGYVKNLNKKLNWKQIDSNTNKNQELKIQAKIELDQQLYRHYLKIFREYKPSVYEGKIVSLETKEFSYRDHPTLQAIAKKGLKFHQINSLHGTLFDEPYIKLFVEELKYYLD